MQFALPFFHVETLMIFRINLPLRNFTDMFDAIDGSVG